MGCKTKKELQAYKWREPQRRCANCDSLYLSFFRPLSLCPPRSSRRCSGSAFIHRVIDLLVVTVVIGVASCLQLFHACRWSWEVTCTSANKIVNGGRSRAPRIPSLFYFRDSVVARGSLATHNTMPHFLEATDYDSVLSSPVCIIMEKT